MKRRIFVLLASLLFRSGGIRLLKRLAGRFEPGFPLVRRRRSRCLPILIYHRVSDVSDPFLPPTPLQAFRGQMEYLAENYTVLDLETAVDAIRRSDLPEDALAITFDDGYRDNYLQAFPVLRDLGLSATVFLATGVIGEERILWHDRVFRAFSLTREAALADFGPQRKTFVLGSDEARCATRAEVLHFLRSLDDEERTGWIERLLERLCVEERTPPVRLMLDWEEIGQMHRHGIRFGAHTVSHPILSRIDEEQARREIVDSKQKIESRLGAKVRAFAYPSGRSIDFDERIKGLVREAGYDCAVTTIPGVNRIQAPPDIDLLELKRAGAWEQQAALFAVRLSVDRLRA